MIRQTNEEIAKIYAWVDANKQFLNIDKTNFMMFMPKGFSYCAEYIVINQTIIQEIKETKFLRDITDNKLNGLHIFRTPAKISLKVLKVQKSCQQWAIANKQLR